MHIEIMREFGFGRFILVPFDLEIVEGTEWEYGIECRRSFFTPAVGETLETETVLYQFRFLTGMGYGKRVGIR